MYGQERVPGTTVTLRAQDEKDVIAITRVDGCATFTSVKPETNYSVRAYLDGFHAEEQLVTLQGSEKRLLKFVLRCSMSHCA